MLNSSSNSLDGLYEQRAGSRAIFCLLPPAPDAVPEGLSGPVSAHILSELVRLSQGPGYTNMGCAGCSRWRGLEGEPMRGLGCQRPFSLGAAASPHITLWVTDIPHILRFFICK